jgi:hypothetical protein
MGPEVGVREGQGIGGKFSDEKNGLSPEDASGVLEEQEWKNEGHFVEGGGRGKMPGCGKGFFDTSDGFQG